MMTSWLFRPVQMTRLNLSLSDATWAMFLKIVTVFGGSVFGFHWDMLPEKALVVARVEGAVRAVL